MVSVSDEEAFAQVEDAAASLAEMIERRARADASAEDVARAMEEAFARRDRVERAAIARGAPSFEPDEVVAVMLFERLVRPLLFRLTEHNERRREALAAIAPAHRARFWWWSEGADVAPHAALSLPAVAHMIARFPAAADALASLVTAQRAWDEVGIARRSGAKVVSLRAWIGEKSRATRGAEPSGIALAAAMIDEEITLVDTDRYQVSFAPPGSIVIDLVADRAPGQIPYLRLDDGTQILSVAVEDAEERFAIAIDGSALDRGHAVLVLPLAQSPLEIPLPPETR